MKEENRLILALDIPDAKQALRFLEPMQGVIQKVKIGPSLFIREGPRFVEAVRDRGFDIFLDLKLHDIPNTVALGVKGAKELGVWMLSLHLSGGKKMLMEAASAAGGSSPILVGITVLTSLTDPDLIEVGMNPPIRGQVSRLAGLARQTGLRGIVASPLEAEMLRKEIPPGMILVTPGIRFGPAKGDDQARTLGPREAVQAGADYLVVGRPLLHSEDPRRFVNEILAEIEGARR